jgi:hypothetical protein
MTNAIKVLLQMPSGFLQLESTLNSEIIRGASQYTKCGGCRGYYGNNINKFGKKKFSSLKCAKTFQKK